MIVNKTNFQEVISKINNAKILSLDCETTGLRPWHGDRLFSLIIAISANESFYFNFQAVSDIPNDAILSMREYFAPLRNLLREKDKTWYLHNAKFDMAMLYQEGLEIEGKVWCTLALGRVTYNEHLSYDLSDSLARIGLEKDDTVEKYIDEKVLWDWEVIPGKKNRSKNKHYERVPFSIIVPYACRDATGTFNLGVFEQDSITRSSSETPSGLPTMLDVAQNEARLIKTVFRMEKVGVRIDKGFCMRAASFEQDRASKAGEKFRKETGREYKDSSKVYAEIFNSERDKWVYTDKGNPSFDKDSLTKFDNPAAKFILELRDAKSKADFYNGFLYHADASGDIHPTFNLHGARHGRFSSSNPNFQNLKADESDSKEEFLVRRAIIPRPDFILIMPDYDQMEYRLMLDLAADLLGRTTDLIEKVKGGLDVHAAVALLANITRDQAKTTNFLTIYGGGNQKLAEDLKISLGEAREIRQSIFRSAPEISNLIDTCMKVAEKRGFIRNWFGRRSYFPVKKFCYRAPNYLVAGGCADVVKLAMNRIDDLFEGKKSRMVLSIHDELPCEIHVSEFYLIPKVKEIMEQAYISKYLPLTCGMEHSFKSLGDKIKGSP